MHHKRWVVNPATFEELSSKLLISQSNTYFNAVLAAAPHQNCHHQSYILKHARCSRVEEPNPLHQSPSSSCLCHGALYTKNNMHHLATSNQWGCLLLKYYAYLIQSSSSAPQSLTNCRKHNTNSPALWFHVRTPLAWWLNDPSTDYICVCILHLVQRHLISEPERREPEQ